MTRLAFLAAYRAQLIASAPYGADPAAVDRVMAAAEHTISTTQSTWIHNGKLSTAAWRAVGGKGVPTLKGLRALP